MKRWLCFFLLLFLLESPVFAVGEEALAPYLPPELSDASGGELLTTGAAELWGEFGAALKEALTPGVRSAALLVLTALLCGFAKGVAADSAVYAELLGVLAISTVAAGDLTALIGAGSRTIDELHTLSKALLPTVAMAMAAGGFVGTASVFQVTTLVAANFLISLIKELLLPLSYCCVGVSAAAAVVSESRLDALAAGLRKLIGGVLSVCLTLFTLFLTLSGVLSGSADKMAVRLAKSTVSAAIPVVGGILSEASEAVLAGAGAARSVCGILGVFAVLFVCLSPLVRLCAQYLLYKAAAVLASCVGVKALDKYIEDVGSVFGLVLGMTGACALLLLVSVLLSITMAVM